MSSNNVQMIMESIARNEETTEELVFNPVTGELEAITVSSANTQKIKPVMTKIAKDGFFS